MIKKVPELDSLISGHAESNLESSTTSTSYQNKLTFTFSVNYSGDYIIFFTSEITKSNSGTDAKFKVRQAGTSITEIIRVNCPITYNNGGWILLSGFKKLTLTKGYNYTFYIDYCAVNYTAYIRNARILIQRVF